MHSPKVWWDYLVNIKNWKLHVIQRTTSFNVWKQSDDDGCNAIVLQSNFDISLLLRLSIIYCCKLATRCAIASLHFYAVNLLYKYTHFSMSYKTVSWRTLHVTYWDEHTSRRRSGIRMNGSEVLWWSLLVLYFD